MSPTQLADLPFEPAHFRENLAPSTVSRRQRAVTAAPNGRDLSVAR